ncbi:hypothetical protein MNEG_8778 [Monoraphidium neglectum]|uniref:Uncharacterized protein n=1 Tax=Monoraphidium neglectum TaxID=145388 RepID=A0A0D2JIQ0_9CHLO|nr:hypothetical protein MNEG_8778 [Monoraphidium neglectum]KIY99182.1 hypothetical protein MNEG_8778 [Monoraphidium neglectum]|eukprot:XP_013898202.1 hypothetical protein MNEG_8778 [Monoraphidium neglectum]
MRAHAALYPAVRFSNRKRKKLAPRRDDRDRVAPGEAAADFYGVERQTNQKPLFRAFVSLGTELRAALGLAASNLRIGNTYCSAEAAARAHDRRAGACGRALLALYGPEAPLVLNFPRDHYTAELAARPRTDEELDAYFQELKADRGAPSAALVQAEADAAAARAAARGARAAAGEEAKRRREALRAGLAPASAFAGVVPAPTGRTWDCCIDLDPSAAAAAAAAAGAGDGRTRRRLVVGRGFASEDAAASAHDR